MQLRGAGPGDTLPLKEQKLRRPYYPAFSTLHTVAAEREDEKGDTFVH